MKEFLLQDVWSGNRRQRQPIFVYFLSSKDIRTVFTL